MSTIVQGHWLIVYDRDRGQLLRCDKYSDASAALSERFRLEQAGATEEIVVLGADSIDALRRTHGRYFTGGVPS